MIRQPIVSVLGHIDHGKTTLLDKIRGSAVAAKEAGGITQHIGATEIPIETVKEICGDLLKTLKTEVTIPGLLFIDTPGHAAFTNLRKRGGSISDLGVLIVDVNEGFKPQTVEAMNVLKSYKTPFLVVANKIDLIPNWISNPDKPFLESLNSQREDSKQTLDSKIYGLVESLYKGGFESERFDRVDDFKKQVAIVPVSAKTGEGIPEFLMVLTGLTQRYMGDSLKIDVKKPGKGTILEVKQSTGLGTTTDVILYDGTIKKGDTIVLGTREEPIHTTIKALLRPNPLQEIRIGQKFKQVEEAHAAAGIKIAAPDLDNALSGAPIVVVPEKEDLNKVMGEVKAEVEEVKLKTDKTGVIVKADTLGSLEALVKMLGDEGIPIRKANFGNVSRKDVVEAETVKNEEPFSAVIFAFNVRALPDVEKEAADFGIKIFEGGVVYGLIDEYKQWKEAEIERAKEITFETVTFPAKIKILPGYVFRKSGPAICGVEVLGGTIKPKYTLMNSEGQNVGTIKGIQQENQAIKEATVGMQVALSISGGAIGKNIKENDILYVRVPPKDIKALKEKLKDLLEPAVLDLLEEIEKVGR